MLSTRLRRIIGVASLAIIASLAAFPALAQFGAPYDPDFAPAPPPATAPAPREPSPEPEGPVPSDGEPFQLLDRPAGAGFLTPAPAASTEAARAPRDPAEVRAGMTPIQYDPSRFVRVREQVDAGEEPGQERTGPDGGPLLVNEDIFLSTSAPKPPPPEVELPTYGTSLSVTGRKVIAFNFSERRFLNSQKTTGRVQTTNLIEIDQQLQLRMQGKVGPKITVNVDYDDTKLNQQDISVVYQGDPSEVVQNVSFGDIDLSLPATEFVSYNKQLFGIRADVKYKGFRSTFIGSRTKGQTKTKQFNGNTQFVATDLQDTSYLRRQYYDVTFDATARLPIRAGTERVFLAKQEIGVANLNEQNLTVDDIVDNNPGAGVTASTFTGRFLPLVAGQDYTIDYAKGIVQFRNQLLPQHVVAIDYLDNAGNQLTLQTSSHTIQGGGSGLFKLIKTPNDVPIAEAGGSSQPQAGYNRELKTFYSIGQNQIVRDNGRGNFFLRVLDLNRNEVGPGLLPQQKYPDTIEVDFENGLFRLKQPFSVGNSSPTTPDPDVYAQTPISKRLFRIEYNFRFRTFFLEPNLVVQSEIVILDGQKLTRNVDFFIDYEAGFITFFNPDRIGPASTIDMTFEVAPFANLNNDTLLGTRVSHEWGPDAKYSVGSTILYQAGSKSPTVPQITELAKSLLVYEFDAQAKRIKIGSKLIMTLAGEFAQSRQNLNLNQFALIDNMEGIKQEEQAPTLAAQWQIASNPGGTAARSDQLNWISEDVNILTINPRAQASASESQKVLQFQYGGATPLADGQEVSIVFPFSISGVDLSQKTVLEVVLLGDGNNNELNFRLGGIDENADGLGILKTEDTNNDGILQPGEDIGFLYSPAAGPSARYGAGNGIIDSFDLNKNGFLNPDDLNGADYGYRGLTAQAQQFHDVTAAPVDRPGGIINFSGPTWHTFQIPLNISTATLSRFTNIKHLRLSIRKRAGSVAAFGTLKFARIAVVGNTWQRGQAGDPALPGSGVSSAGEALTVTPVNSVDNPTYTPIFNAAGDGSQVFNDLYGSLSALQRQSNTKNLSEQALQLEYVNLAAGTTVYTKRVFSRAIDISQHKDFNFLIFGNAAAPVNVTGNQVFFLRAGSDQDYFEVQVPITFSGWKKIRVKQTDRNKDSVMDDWTADIPGTVVVSSGNPSLQQVGQLVTGLYNRAGPNANGAVFLNEIHLAEPVTRVGTAQKIQADFETPGWATFGLKRRSIDRNFQTPTSVVANQDNTEDSSYLSLTRLAWFPMSFNINRHIRDTPSTVQTGSLSNLVNLLQQGKVTTWVGSAQGNIAYGAYPRLTLSHTRNRVEYELLTRLDDRQTYNGTMQYGVPSQSRFLPRTIDANAGFIKYDVSFDDPFVKRAVGNFDTAERTNSYGTRLTFTPWTGSSFNPTWSMTKVTESRVDSTGVAPISSRYPKSFSQYAGVASNFRLTSWLNPQFNYQIDSIENNILSVSTFIVNASTFVFQPGDIKTVNRSANASISLPIQISDIFPRSKLFRSVNIISGYQMQDGDVWNQVEQGLSTQKALWIRTPLRPTNPAAQRVNLTLRDTYNSTQRWTPLDGYDLRGRKAALRTISLSNNYVLSVQRNEMTGTPSKTITRTLPDAVASISQLERLWWSERWMANTQMNFRYSNRTTENVGSTLQTEDSFGTDLRTIVIKKYETLISYNRRSSNNKDLRIDANTQKTKHEDITTQVTFDIRKFRITPKVDYAKDTAQLGTGVKTQDVEVITPSILIRADLALPAGLRLPGSAKPLLFTNRIIWTTTASLAQRRSPVTVADNSKLFSLNTSGDYEIAKNLRMTLNGSAQRLWHRFLKEEDFVAYAFGTTLTFQF